MKLGLALICLGVGIMLGMVIPRSNPEILAVAILSMVANYYLGYYCGLEQRCRNEDHRRGNPDV